MRISHPHLLLGATIPKRQCACIVTQLQLTTISEIGPGWEDTINRILDLVHCQAIFEKLEGILDITRFLILTVNRLPLGCKGG